MIAVPVIPGALYRVKFAGHAQHVSADHAATALMIVFNKEIQE